MQNINCIIDTSESGWHEKASKNLDTIGVTVLRNIVNKETIQKINSDVKDLLSKRSMSGLYGYIQKDAFKKMFDGFLVSSEVIKILANQELIKLAKNYLEDDILITECFFKHDLGNNSVYFPYHRHTGSDLFYTDDKNKFGCGVILYLHDTDSGAFCYLPGSHKYAIQNKKEFLLSESKEYRHLKSEISRINGQAGDLVIFNEAGYHGPEQPVKKTRSVIISGFQSKKMSQNKTRTEIPILLSNLNSLNEEQLSVIGFGSGSRSNYQSYHIRKKNNSFYYKFINSLLDLIFKLQRLKHKIDFRNSLNKFFK